MKLLSTLARTVRTASGCNDDFRRIERRVVGDGTGCGLARPAAIESRSRGGQLSIRRRRDFKTAIAGTLAGLGKIAALVVLRVIGQRDQERAVDYRLRHGAGPIETELV